MRYLLFCQSFIHPPGHQRCVSTEGQSPHKGGVFISGIPAQCYTKFGLVQTLTFGMVTCLTADEQPSVRQTFHAETPVIWTPPGA